MRAGTLKHRISIQQKIQTSDDMGGYTETWEDLYSVWAAIWPLSGKEYLASGRKEGEVTHRIRIRYRDGILPSHRVKYGSRIFDIRVGLNHEEQNKYLDLMCIEKVA